MMNKTLLSVALLIAGMGAAQAQMTTTETVVIPAPMHFFLGFGAGAGGDELISATTTDGDIETLKAGSGVTFAAGVDYRINPSFSMLASVAYQTDRRKAENGTLEFSRVPVELLAFWHPSANWRVGGGLRYVSNAKLTGSGVVSMRDIDFDSSTSGVLEGEYLMGPHLGFQLRYVHDSYKVDGVRGKIDGNHAALGMRYYF